MLRKGRCNQAETSIGHSIAGRRLAGAGAAADAMPRARLTWAANGRLSKAIRRCASAPTRSSRSAVRPAGIMLAPAHTMPFLRQQSTRSSVSENAFARTAAAADSSRVKASTLFTQEHQRQMQVGREHRTPAVCRRDVRAQRRQLRPHRFVRHQGKEQAQVRFAHTSTSAPSASNPPKQRRDALERRAVPT